MFKAVIGKLACGAVLLIGFTACGAGSEGATEDQVAPSAGTGLDASGEISAMLSRAAANAEEAAPEAGDTSADVEASGLVCTECYVSLPPCFVDRDAVFAQTGILCVCQPPDLDQCCSTDTVDLECNL